MPRRAAPSKLAPVDSASDSESDAPETVTLASAQKAVKKQAGEVEAFKAAERAKVKAQRRQRDEKGKERAKERREVDEAEGREGEEEAKRLMKRMERAMEEAGDESISEEEDEEVGGSDNDEGLDDDEDKNSEANEDDVEVAVEDDSGVSSDDNTESEGDESEASEDAPPIGLVPSRTKRTPRHLPDALFASAFASQAAAASVSASAIRTSKRPAPAIARKDTKRARKGVKDMLVGARTIRTLSSNTQHHLSASQRTVPPPKVAKFAERNLGLSRTSKTSSNKWERRPANLGVLKRGGPAAHFARTQS